MEVISCGGIFLTTSYRTFLFDNSWSASIVEALKRAAARFLKTQQI